MNKFNREKIRKMILKEFKMMGMASMGSPAMEPMDMTHSHEVDHTAPTVTGGVSKEDCCAAVMCLIECCSCPVTKQALMQCCQDILSGRM